MKYCRGLMSLFPRASFGRRPSYYYTTRWAGMRDRIAWESRHRILRYSWGLGPLRTAGLRAAGGRQVLRWWLERRPKEGPDGKSRPPRPKQLAAPDSHTGSHVADRDPLGFAICRTISAGLDPLSIESFTEGISQPGWRATRLSLHHLTISSRYHEQIHTAQSQTRPTTENYSRGVGGSAVLRCINSARGLIKNSPLHTLNLCRA